ncbi:MAG: flagellar biosynthetic protein FliO [Deltaproteobacteria bacterium]|nr:flagellar biosynthetic protein FliO [Deltaproteobacteria bacterium]
MMDELYLGLIKVLLFFLGMMGILILVKRSGFKFYFGSERKDEDRYLRKLDTIHLGYRKFVTVVEIDGRVLVIGVSDKEISVLAQWRKEGNE